MSDHLVLYVDRLLRPMAAQQPSEPPEVSSVPEPEPEPAGPDPVPDTADPSSSSSAEGAEEEEPLIQTAECRICQDEDSISNLESPCACCGSLKYAHRKCVQHWCNEKGDITCEICHQTYQPGYTAPPRPPSDETTIEIGGGWTLSGTPLSLDDPRILSITEAERQYLDTEYDEYSASSSSGAPFFRSAALILMALLILRHALRVTDSDNGDDTSAIFSLFLLRAAGFLLPAILWLGPSVSCSVDSKDRRLQHWQQHKLLLFFNLDNIWVYNLQ
ncbi:hypothetical protein PRUPE_1G274900 [Prunus persica]|uniref:RING-CH-type domain-containing protein n=1 Tax=Prunus persica TaxID=3760 RepID=M5XQH9_PRUPE|nr:hypothetical protein PRUPE_1G274900 [Prunus persica]ONI30815.1 hypothetical protein PRUPE_1G274900 [Prunus persica]